MSNYEITNELLYQKSCLIKQKLYWSFYCNLEPYGFSYLQTGLMSIPFNKLPWWCVISLGRFMNKFNKSCIFQQDKRAELFQTIAQFGSSFPTQYSHKTATWIWAQKVLKNICCQFISNTLHTRSWTHIWGQKIETKLKFRFSKKVTKIWKNLPLVLTLLRKSQNKCKIFLCGLLRIS